METIAYKDDEAALIEFFARTRNVAMFMSTWESRSRRAAVAHAEPEVATAAVSLAGVRSEMVAAVSVVPGWWVEETAAWLPGWGRDRVTAGHLASSDAPPDEAVSDCSPRVFDPGLWMPRPSLELNKAASTAGGSLAVDAWSSALGEAEAVFLVAVMQLPPHRQLE